MTNLEFQETDWRSTTGVFIVLPDSHSRTFEMVETVNFKKCEINGINCQYVSIAFNRKVPINK